MVAYNGTVAVLCFMVGLIAWKLGTRPPAFPFLGILLGVGNAYCAISRWRRTRARQ